MAEDTTPPEKRRGRKRSDPPSMASVTSLFPGAEPPASKVVIPPPGKSSKQGDKRRMKAINMDGPGSDQLRVGKRWAEIITSVNRGDYTWDEFVDALDDQELARGQIKAVDGTFRGRPPQLVPRAFFNACQQAIMKRARVTWLEGYPEALKAIVAIANDKDVKTADRLKAAFFVAERIEGKAVQPMTVAVEDPWQTMLAGVVAEVSEDEAIARAHDYSAREGATSVED